MATWRHHAIREVLTKIEGEEWVLPVSQRALVWKEDQIKLLFDTLLKGNSFGGIMAVEDIKEYEPLFWYRGFVTDHFDKHQPESRQEEKLKKNICYIVDGQQRLSAINIGIKGKYNEKRLFFDLFSDYTEKKFNFHFAKNENKLPAEYEGKKTSWYPLFELYRKIEESGFKPYSVFDQICGTMDLADEEKPKIERNICLFCDAVTEDVVGICTVEINRARKDASQNRNDIVELFIRLNTGGTRLGITDLMSSRLKGLDPKSEAFLYEMQDNNDIDFTQAQVIRLIFLLQGDVDKKLDDIDKKDADFIIENGDRIEKSLGAVHRYLEEAKLLKWKPPINILYTICYHFYYREDLETYFGTLDTETGGDFGQLDRWVKHWMLRGILTVGRGLGWTPNTTGLRKVIGVMKQNKGKDFPAKEIFDCYRDHSWKTKEIASQELAIDTIDEYGDQDFMLYLIYIDQPSIQDRKNDWDHIHPQSILWSLDYEWEDINSIGNRQQLAPSVNRGDKKGKKFADWLHSLDNKDGFINMHLIPNDEKLWNSNHFPKFLKERKRMIIEKIRSFVQIPG